MVFSWFWMAIWEFFWWVRLGCFWWFLVDVSFCQSFSRLLIDSLIFVWIRGMSKKHYENMGTYHIISYHFIWFHFISFHFIWFDLISFHHIIIISKSILCAFRLGWVTSHRGRNWRNSRRRLPTSMRGWRWMRFGKLEKETWRRNFGWFDQLGEWKNTWIICYFVLQAAFFLRSENTHK